MKAGHKEMMAEKGTWRKEIKAYLQKAETYLESKETTSENRANAAPTLRALKKRFQWKLWEL
jgi:hypothetical protein